MRTRPWAIALGTLALVAGALALRVRQVARRSLTADPSSAAHVVGSREAAEIAYDGALGDGWEDWGWGPHEMPKTGPAKVKFAGYGGIVLHHAELRRGFGAFSFRYKSPATWPDYLGVALQGTGSPTPQVTVQARHVAPLADGWREVSINWSELNPENRPFDRVAITARSSVPAEWVLLDKILFTKSSGTSAGQAPVRDVDLSVTCDGASHAISPLIYGGSGADKESGVTGERFGGNPMTRMNWEPGDLWNTGNDWFFENIKLNGTIWDWLAAAIEPGSQNALVVPLIGWVAKDGTSVGFARDKFPKQKKFDPNRPEAGDGHRPDGSDIPPGPPTNTSVAATPEVIGRWIRTLRDKDRARGNRAVQEYILDNEPSLWNSTHRDVHPDPITYDELLDRTIRYATEIRNADPEAVIAGPAEWGWRGYLMSGKDQAASFGLQPDRSAHDDLPLVAWYLKKLAEHERTTGARLLDVLDLHFYPAADGLYGQGARVDQEGAELRVRSTRALWDPNYRDESWIKDTVRLIPRMKEWVSENYPGRKLSIGEWSFGADEHISGGVATAEALGRFGEQGLDSAFYWGGPKKGTATFWAFRAFRNFDGAGGHFLDVSLPTRESEQLSLFASSDDSRSHLVLIAVNRDSTYAAHTRIRLGGCGTPISNRTFTYAAGFSALKVGTLDANGGSGPELTIQPFSFVVIDLQLRPR